jgi:hypothetical protein
MSSLPPFVLFVNGDITYRPEPPPNPPDLPVFIGSQPQLTSSYASVSELKNLQIQLFIDDTMTKEEFDARVCADPNYPTIIHLRGLRILVILPTFRDYHNRELADIVLFLHQGMADVLTNRFQHFEEDYEHEYDGYRSHTYPYPPQPHYEYPDEHRPRKFAVGPPGQSYDIQRLNVYELIRAAHSCGGGDFFLPFEMMPHCRDCNYPYYCDYCHTFSGIKICRDCCGPCKCGCGTYLIDNQGVKESPIHLKNCDNEYNNYAFIHRK